MCALEDEAGEQTLFLIAGYTTFGWRAKNDVYMFEPETSHWM